jgi:formylmethanofuran dehydrogenase subunit E
MLNERIPVMPFTPAHLDLQAAQLTCTECGETFEPRRIGDGVQELCDACYEDRFRTPQRREERLHRRVA